MARFEIVQQRPYADLLVVLKFSCTIDGVINHSQESISVYMVVDTGLTHRLVAEAQTDAKASQSLQQIVIVADERNHLVVRFIHFLIFHT